MVSAGVLEPGTSVKTLTVQLNTQGAITIRVMWLISKDLSIVVERATNVPSMDVMSKSDAFCTVGVCDAKGNPVDLTGEGKTNDDDMCKTRVVSDTSDPEWKTTVVLSAPTDQWLEDLKQQKTFIHFKLYDQDRFTRDFIGQAIVSLESLQRHPGQERILLLQTKTGDPVLNKTPLAPCELVVRLADVSAASSGADVVEKETRHIFMMSR